MSSRFNPRVVQALLLQPPAASLHTSSRERQRINHTLDGGPHLEKRPDMLCTTERFQVNVYACKSS